MRGVTTGFACFVVACGARSEIAGGGNGAGFDASFLDVALVPDAAKHTDGAPQSDAADDAAACVVTSVAVGCAGPNGGDCAQYGCKFDVEWTCGTTSFRSGGACAPPDAGPPSGAYEGVCDANGKQTSTYGVPAVTCDCEDKDALAGFVVNLCTQQ